MFFVLSTFLRRKRSKDECSVIMAKCTTHALTPISSRAKRSARNA